MAGPALFEEHPRPVLSFLPYLPMREPVVFAGWWLGPLKDFEGEWANTRFAELSRQFLSSFLDADGNPIENPALLARVDDGVTGRLPAATVRTALQRAIDLAVLDGNPNWEPESQGWWVTTSDSSELFMWPIDIDEGRVALTRGSMVPIISGGHKIEPGLHVPAAREVHLPWRVNIDEHLLSAAYLVFSGAHDQKDSNLAGRLGESTTWLAKVWRNTESIQGADRVVMLKIGFDALTGTDRTHVGAQWLRELFGDLATAGTDDDDAEHLLWSPSETPQRTRIRRDTGEPEKCTDLEHWFKTFGDTRNEIVHTGRVRALTFEEPGSAYSGPMVFIGERLLREAIRLAFARFGYQELWQDPLHRALARRFRNAEHDEGNL
jgi:hypothetical protein